MSNVYKDTNDSNIAADSSSSIRSGKTSPLTTLKRKLNRTEAEAREIRLEQNRVAARESRKRKKKMIEDLQQSIVFYTRANSLLKQQNDYMQQIIAEKTAEKHKQALNNATADPTIAAAQIALNAATTNLNADIAGTASTSSAIPSLSMGMNIIPEIPNAALMAATADASGVSTVPTSLDNNTTNAALTAALGISTLLPPSVYAAVMQQMLSQQNVNTTAAAVSAISQGGLYNMEGTSYEEGSNFVAMNRDGPDTN